MEHHNHANVSQKVSWSCYLSTMVKILNIVACLYTCYNLIDANGVMELTWIEDIIKLYTPIHLGQFL